MNAKNCDPLALRVAEVVHHRENPQATILFGSRARGDHEDHHSDIDIMLVLPEEPGRDHKESVAEWAEEAALTTYGHKVPVQLVWFARADFIENQRYINHVATRALIDGIIMSTNPEEFHNSYSDNEETEYEYDWTDYQNRLYHAESHLTGFDILDSSGANDLLVAQQAQSALEHAMKAIIAGHGGTYRDTHNLGLLLGALRRIDPEMSEFSLSITPDIYSEYAGQDEYRGGRKQPLLTQQENCQENYRERTVIDIRTLIDRARELGPAMYPKRPQGPIGEASSC